MPALEPLCYLARIKPSKFSKEENILLEAEFFTRLCSELKEFFREQNKNYFYLMKFNLEQENEMLEKNFVPSIINDMLSTKEYTLEGIACYTNTPIDIVEELLYIRITRPSALFLRQLMELHRSIRQTLYSTLIKKILKEYSDNPEIQE